MKIKRLVVGELEENCYIVIKNNKAIIIDPGAEGKKIIDSCKGIDVVEVLVTHHHFDHIGALKDIENHFHIKENVFSGNFDYEIIKNPGHTSDSISFYFKKEKLLFCGDFIFFNSIGRMDLPTGSTNEMKKSLEIISKYPDDVVIYPGHGKKTVLGYEKENFKLFFPF